MKDLKQKDLKHGMAVTCIINDHTVKDAKISIDSTGDIYICQNILDGTTANLKLGYKYSWIMYIASVVKAYELQLKQEGISELKSSNRTIKDGVMLDDIIVCEDKERKILGSCDKVIFVSQFNNFEVAASSSYTLHELIGLGYKLKEEIEEEWIPKRGDFIYDFDDYFKLVSPRVTVIIEVKDDKIWLLDYNRQSYVKKCEFKKLYRLATQQEIKDHFNFKRP